MNLVAWLKKWNMTSLKFNTSFLEMEFNPSEPDKDAAWELYIELLTRVTTQRLYEKDGDELTALSSIHSLFSITRTIIKSHGRGCNEFTKIAVVVLNQIIRPFTSKWHRVSIETGFNSDEIRDSFRKDLEQLQEILINYTKMLSDMAGVEDLTDLEQ